MLKACPHHGFTELTQVDTFSNGLNENDQDSLNAAAGGNLLSKKTREALNIIENKSKVHYSRNKLNVSRMNTTSRESVSKTDKRIDKLADQLSTLVEIVSKKVVTPAPVKAVEEICVTCSGPHAWYNCPNTDNNQSSVCAATGTYNQVNPPNRVSNQMAPPGFAPVQNNGQNRFAPTIKSLLMNKEKLLELAKIPLNENCSTMLLKKIPEKPWGDPEHVSSFYVISSIGSDRSITRPKGFVEYVFVKVGSFHFPTDFVVVDFEADPRVPLILGRSFLRTSHALIDVYEGELILRDVDERLIFHVNKHPQKHANESIKMINFIDVSCEDSVGEVLRLKKSNHFLSGSTTSLSDSSPSITSFETSDSLLEEFADELAFLDPFPPGNKDVDVEAKLREIELLLNHDPSTNFSPTITIDPNPKKFTNEPAPACLPPPGDDESFLKEDVQKENFQVYSNPLFEFDDNYNSSNINPLFKEMLEKSRSNDHNVF
ncbi:reverse transcriptase domain-containing protein [Tanacetum coccineum]